MITSLVASVAEACCWPSSLRATSLHTLAMSLVNCVMKLEQARASECDLSDLSLREVVNWGVILGAVVSKIESSWGPEVPELILRVSAA